MSPDDLQIASWSIVPDILKILEADFPHSIPAYRYLELYLKWKTEDVPDLDVFILTPGGKVDKYGTFILRAAEHRNNFVMYSLNPDVDQVKSLILNANLIEWDKYPLWGPVCEKIYPLLNEVFAIKNLKKVFQDFEGHMFHLDKELAKEITYSCPPEVYIDQLKADEADLIDSYWPHRGGNSAEITRFVVKQNGGVGLYDKETNELIAWVLIFMHNGPGQLFVMDKCKRKGYGTLVAKVASKLVAENNIDPVAFIHVDNIASQKLFTNLGYKKLRKVYWCCATSVQN